MSCDHKRVRPGPQPRWRVCAACGETLRPLLVTLDEEVAVARLRAGTPPPQRPRVAQEAPMPFPANTARGQRVGVDR